MTRAGDERQRPAREVEGNVALLRLDRQRGEPVRLVDHHGRAITAHRCGQLGDGCLERISRGPDPVPGGQLCRLGREVERCSVVVQQRPAVRLDSHFAKRANSAQSERAGGAGEHHAVARAAGRDVRNLPAVTLRKVDAAIGCVGVEGLDRGLDWVGVLTDGSGRLQNHGSRGDIVQLLVVVEQRAGGGRDRGHIRRNDGVEHHVAPGRDGDIVGAGMRIAAVNHHAPPGTYIGGVARFLRRDRVNQKPIRLADKHAAVIGGRCQDPDRGPDRERRGPDGSTGGAAGGEVDGSCSDIAGPGPGRAVRDRATGRVEDHQPGAGVHCAQRDAARRVGQDHVAVCRLRVERPRVDLQGIAVRADQGVGAGHREVQRACGHVGPCVARIGLDNGAHRTQRHRPRALDVVNGDAAGRAVSAWRDCQGQGDRAAPGVNRGSGRHLDLPGAGIPVGWIGSRVIGREGDRAVVGLGVGVDLDRSARLEGETDPGRRHVDRRVHLDVGVGLNRHVGHGRVDRGRVDGRVLRGVVIERVHIGQPRTASGGDRDGLRVEQQRARLTGGRRRVDRRGQCHAAAGADFDEAAVAATGAAAGGERPGNGRVGIGPEVDAAATGISAAADVDHGVRREQGLAGRAERDLAAVGALSALGEDGVEVAHLLAGEGDLAECRARFSRRHVDESFVLDDPLVPPSHDYLAALNAERLGFEDAFLVDRPLPAPRPPSGPPCRRGW